MKIGIVGTGYVGLVTGACLAEVGHDVVCIDRDAGKIALLETGGCPIYEPGLPELIGRNRNSGRLTFSTRIGDGVRDAEAVFIAVGTPPGANGDADLRFVHAVAEEIADHLSGFTVVVTKSTVPVGTGDQVEGLIRRRRAGADFAVVSNPEFLREGCAIGDFLKPDRIVVGADEPRAREVMAAVYQPLTRQGAPLLMTERRTSELIKYASNAFLAVKISYINEMADLCEEVGADALKVAEGMGLDPRIGGRFLQPGPGYGGSCFPKDTKALLSTGAQSGVRLRVVQAAEEANADRKRCLAARVTAVAGDLQGKTVAVLGLAFKAGTDDMREAASLDLIPELQARGATVRAFDPEAMEAAAPMLPGAIFCRDAYHALDGADVAIVLTEWDDFADLDLGRAAERMRRRLMVDFRNLYRPGDVTAAGIDYVSLGRPAASAERHRRAVSSVDADEAQPLQRAVAE